MTFKNKNFLLNVLQIVVFLGILQIIIQYIVILFLFNNYNKFLTQQIFKLFILLLKNQFLKKINRCLNFFNRISRLFLINLIDLLLKRKKNNFIIKFLFTLLKIQEKRFYY